MELIDHLISIVTYLLKPKPDTEKNNLPFDGK